MRFQTMKEKSIFQFEKEKKLNINFAFIINLSDEKGYLLKL